jgi:hypothetical protein
VVSNYKQVIATYEGSSESIRTYFYYLTELIERYPWEVSLSYISAKIEDAKRIALYFGLVRLHDTDATETRQWVRDLHLSRADFLALFQTIYGAAIPDKDLDFLDEWERVRDRMAHAQEWKDSEARLAIVHALRFAAALNELVRSKGVTEPFNGDKRGWRGRKKSLPVDTSRWILRGIWAAAGEVKQRKRKPPVGTPALSAGHP